MYTLGTCITDYGVVCVIAQVITYHKALKTRKSGGSPLCEHFSNIPEELLCEKNRYQSREKVYTVCLEALFLRLEPDYWRKKPLSLFFLS